MGCEQTDVRALWEYRRNLPREAFGELVSKALVVVGGHIQLAHKALSLRHGCGVQVVHFLLGGWQPPHLRDGPLVAGDGGLALVDLFVHGCHFARKSLGQLVGEALISAHAKHKNHQIWPLLRHRPESPKTPPLSNITASKTLALNEIKNKTKIQQKAYPASNTLSASVMAVWSRSCAAVASSPCSWARVASEAATRACTSSRLLCACLVFKQIDIIYFAFYLGCFVLLSFFLCVYC